MTQRLTKHLLLHCAALCGRSLMAQLQLRLKRHLLRYRQTGIL